MIGDTIVARASAAGSSERAVVRLSGPRAREVAALVFAPALPAVRAVVDGQVLVRGRSVPAMALSMPGPRSFTGEDVVELHVPGSMLLVQELLAAMLADGEARGVREALPGEFTARAVQHGRLSPANVEGLLLLLHAADARAAAAAVSWLRGVAADELRTLRSRLQDVLALLEAGLDFEDVETGAVQRQAWHEPLHAIGAGLDALLAAVPAAAAGGEVLLLGAANAGKSSLCNALAGRDAVLVDGTAGTTRDLLRVELPGGGVLWDAPGDVAEPSAVDAAALALRDRLGGGSAGAFVVLAADAPVPPQPASLGHLPVLGVVWTKCDLAAPGPLPPTIAAAAGEAPVFATSARTGLGIEPLRAHLATQLPGGAVDAGGPLRAALRAAGDAVARALAADAGPEVAAVELQQALRALDAIAGPHSPEDVLERIYARFCLGK
jgi:tRNA modification GTPase